MHVTEIIVNAGRTFNHPHETYSNLRPEVTLKATLDPGEDFTSAAKQLQAQAETLVEDHKNHLLKSINDLYDLSLKTQRMSQLGKAITSAQRELDDMRDQYPELKQLGLPIGVNREVDSHQE